LYVDKYLYSMWRDRDIFSRYKSIYEAAAPQIYMTQIEARDIKNLAINELMELYHSSRANRDGITVPRTFYGLASALERLNIKWHANFDDPGFTMSMTNQGDLNVNGASPYLYSAEEHHSPNWRGKDEDPHGDPKATMIHEAYHLYNESWPRMGPAIEASSPDYIPRGGSLVLWNFATDYIMNRDIVWWGFAMKTIALIPVNRDGTHLSKESYPAGESWIDVGSLLKSLASNGFFINPESIEDQISKIDEIVDTPDSPKIECHRDMTAERLFDILTRLIDDPRNLFDGRTGGGEGVGEDGEEGEDGEGGEGEGGQEGEDEEEGGEGGKGEDDEEEGEDEGGKGEGPGPGVERIPINISDDIGKTDDLKKDIEKEVDDNTSDNDAEVNDIPDNQSTGKGGGVDGGSPAIGYVSQDDVLQHCHKWDWVSKLKAVLQGPDVKKWSIQQPDRRGVIGRMGRGGSWISTPPSQIKVSGGSGSEFNALMYVDISGSMTNYFEIIKLGICCMLYDFNNASINFELGVVLHGSRVADEILTVYSSTGSNENREILNDYWDRTRSGLGMGGVSISQAAEHSVTASGAQKFKRNVMVSDTRWTSPRPYYVEDANALLHDLHSKDKEFYCMAVNPDGEQIEPMFYDITMHEPENSYDVAGNEVKFKDVGDGFYGGHDSDGLDIDIGRSVFRDDKIIPFF
jgi:hypothetical protein